MDSFDAKWEAVREGGGEDLFTADPGTQLELLYHHRHRQIEQFLLRASARHGGRGTGSRRTLEVGCGRGTVSQYLAAGGHRVTLLDLSDDALKIARANFARHGLAGEFVAGDAEALPFEDGSFDFAFSLGLLEHFEDPAAIVREKLRVCAPGGVAWDEVIPRKPSVQWLAAPLTGTQLAAHRVKSRLLGRQPVRRHHRTRMTPAQGRALYEAAGAREVASFGALPIPNFPIPDGSRPARLAVAAERRFLAMRERRMEDPWRCSYAWGQSFVVYGIR